MPNGLIFAHRGATGAARENTLDAFRAAIAAGADGLELDVHATSDGNLVVHHDDAIGGAVIAAMNGTASREAAQRLGYALPDLGEVIEVARGRARLDIELKSPGCEKAVLKLLADNGLSAADAIVTSFDANVVKRIIAIDADVLTGWLVKDGTPAAMIDAWFECGADVLAPRHDLLNADFLREAEAEEVALLPWTVNDAGSMRWLLRSDAVLGIITDKVSEAVRVRNDSR